MNSKTCIELFSGSSKISSSLIEERIFECTNYLIQKVDASGIVTPEQQKIFNFISYIENGKNKPFK